MRAHLDSPSTGRRRTTGLSEVQIALLEQAQADAGEEAEEEVIPSAFNYDGDGAHRDGDDAESGGRDDGGTGQRECAVVPAVDSR